MELLSSPHSPA